MLLGIERVSRTSRHAGADAPAFVAGDVCRECRARLEVTVSIATDGLIALSFFPTEAWTFLPNDLFVSELERIVGVAVRRLAPAAVTR